MSCGQCCADTGCDGCVIYSAGSGGQRFYVSTDSSIGIRVAECISASHPDLADITIDYHFAGIIFADPERDFIDDGWLTGGWFLRCKSLVGADRVNIYIDCQFHDFGSC